MVIYKIGFAGNSSDDQLIGSGLAQSRREGDEKVTFFSYA
jgi:hypothetical protein